MKLEELRRVIKTIVESISDGNGSSREEQAILKLASLLDIPTESVTFIWGKLNEDGHFDEGQSGDYDNEYDNEYDEPEPSWSEEIVVARINGEIRDDYDMGFCYCRKGKEAIEMSDLEGGDWVEIPVTAIMSATDLEDLGEEKATEILRNFFQYENMAR